MAIRTSEEEKRIQQKRLNFKTAFRKFRDMFFISFRLGIKFGGILLAVLIAAYVIAKFLFRWDLFYETDLNYPAIAIILAAIFSVLMIACIIVSIVLYKNKHSRNTKYATTKTK